MLKDKGAKLEAMRGELRRGVLILAVLEILENEHYGYSLRKVLQAAAIDIEEGTLYPLVRRLESYGLLSSRWSAEGGRKRRYYQISTEGEQVLAELQAEWQRLHQAIQQITEAGHGLV